MCSKAVRPDDPAARLGLAIDELAELTGAAEEPACADLTARLAAAWALVTAADPELAERTARYSG
jgi:hypothetical protein